MDKETVRKRLHQALAKRLDGAFDLHELELLTGGSAAQTWRFVLEQDSTATEYILRLAHGGDQFELGIDKTSEACVQSLAVDHSVLAPRIILTIEPEDQLGEGFIMELIHGETIPQKILRQEQYLEARAQMAEQCGRLLAQIHQVPIQSLGFLRDLSAAPQLALLKSLYQGFGALVPIFDYAFHWLEQNIPDCPEKTLVHADFRNGNLIVDETGIVSVLDWELAHIGDPMEDLGWLCVNSWRFGNSEYPVGGFGSRKDLYAAYEATSGVKVDPISVRFWETLGVLKWGVICIYQTDIHLSGEERSVNRAAIGRRVSEAELDLLVLLKNTH